MPVDGIGVTYVTAGFLLVYAGYKNIGIKAELTSFLKGQIPKGSPTGAPTIGISKADSGSSGGSSSDTSGSGYQNELSVARYLMANGYSAAAAAGIAACIAGESSGNPEAMQGGSSGGGGLIQWTPISAYPGLVTGNPTADLRTQEAAILAYNNAQGASQVAFLNSISDPVQAADYYSKYFERPLITYSDVRTNVATSVYAALTGK